MEHLYVNFIDPSGIGFLRYKISCGKKTHRQTAMKTPPPRLYAIGVGKNPSFQQFDRRSLDNQGADWLNMEYNNVKLT